MVAHFNEFCTRRNKWRGVLEKKKCAAQLKSVEKTLITLLMR